MLQCGDQVLVEHLPIGLTALLGNPAERVSPGGWQGRLLCFLQRDVSRKGFIKITGPVPLAFLSSSIKNIDYAVPGVPKALTATAQMLRPTSRVTVQRCVIAIVVL